MRPIDMQAEYDREPDQPATPLDRIDDFARQAERIGDVVQSFINRCRGGGETADGSAKVPHPTGHLYNLERLEKNLARAEELARELGQIG